MSLFRFLVFSLIFYLLIKAVRFVVRYLKASNGANNSRNSGQYAQKQDSKYKNIEEANYVEIKDIPVEPGKTKIQEEK